MKKYLCHMLYGILAVLTVCSCNTPNQDNDLVIQPILDTESIPLPAEDSIQIDSLVEILKLPLPFAASEIAISKTYTLPEIDTAIYLKLNTNFDSNLNNAENLKHLKAFNCQLPNVNKYEVYYFECNCSLQDDLVPTVLCDNLADGIYGFLIFYERTSKEAQIINMKNSYYIDSAIEMNFIIDEDYSIHLTEMGMTDGEADEEDNMDSESYALSKHLIEIDTNGVIKIAEVN